MIAGIFNFFSALLGKIVAFAEWLLLVIVQLFKDLYAMVMDVFAGLFDAILGICSTALNAISTPFDPQTYYGMIPAETANVLGYIGVTQALSMIVASLLIRFLLQTIPFVRWGS